MKLQEIFERMKFKVEPLHKLEHRPVYYYNWVRRLIKVQFQLLRIKYHG